MAKKEDGMNDNTGKAADPDSSLVHSGGGFYEINVKGQLDARWSDWLEGLEMKLLDNGEMILFGPIVDQAALMGILNKLSHLNLALLSVNLLNRKFI
jgi:hypothetical protein